MKKQHTKKIVRYDHHDLPADTKTDWKRVDAMSEKELQDNANADKDTIIADEKFWREAHLAMPLIIGKERITIRIDTDILHWLKDQGRGYQSRINAILRTVMTTMKSGRHRKVR